MRILKRLALPLGALAVAGLCLAGTPAVAATTAAPAAVAGSAQTYLVLYKGNSVTPASLGAVTALGGKVVNTFPEIGVAVVTSDRTDFAAALRTRDKGVSGAAATARLGVQLHDDEAAAAADPAVAALGADLTGLQWDMDQIKAPDAHAINPGSPSVVVGDIDTGLDWSHPNLAPNVDWDRSVSCVDGVPNQDPAAWMDDNGHGTHTAGTIAAADTGSGIVGVAPGVKVAGIKAGNADGFFFPEAVVCSFMWAGAHGIQVTNNSYFADPWLYNCKNDPEQRAIWEAERRAISWAQKQGVLVVAAEGNESDDLAHPTQDVTSPDDSTPVTREISNACAVVPVEVPGVIGVSANGSLGFKSYYSSYGVGAVDVVAPGGDRRFQIPAATGNGRVLSTWPAALTDETCAVPLAGEPGYCWAQGTSMASPHAAGVAALIVSTGVTSPQKIAAMLQQQADPIACPTDMSVYANFPSVSNGAPQVCQGGMGSNGFNGRGQVNALTAVGG
ncbi:S8 family serine peptidase [Microbacterium sp. SS28]|uniref:S8 family serine peptidase n=1 Tax=Microbacterium sp. SS28 TaxID=2919948 RepID=UPI001FAA69CA|nr:S8 family serine peptidase [Microbacterium sp. SS28]